MDIPHEQGLVVLEYFPLAMSGVKAVHMLLRNNNDLVCCHTTRGMIFRQLLNSDVLDLKMPA